MKKIKQIFAALLVSILLLGNSAGLAHAVAPWNSTGTYEITFLLTGDPTLYTHHATLTQTGTAVTGSGGYPATGSDVYHWHTTDGDQTGDALNLTADYDLGAIGTTMHMMGTIAVDGTTGGTWDDNFGSSRSGTWSITKGVSVPMIHTPANGASVSQAALVKVDWTDSIGANPPFEYQYESYSDASYSGLLFSSTWLAASEIPTPGTPPGDYYLRVRARNASTESAWSNGAGNAYHITVTENPVNGFEVPAECSQSTVYNKIDGTNASEIINGTSGADLIMAGNGSDVVNGNGGNDCIVGGNGSDVLRGDAGNDVILGGEGSDSLTGGLGNDDLYGENASDALAGNEGDDRLWGGNGSDSLQGGANIDTADGGNGSDACSAETLTQCNP